MPINTVPTAPMPVHTAYAVPIGNVCVAFINSNILAVRQIKKPAYQYSDVELCVSLALPRQVAKATSKRPAIMSNIQFTINSF